MISPFSTAQTKTLNNRNLLHEQSALIESLEKKIESPNLHQFYTQTSLYFPERQSPDKQRYAIDLLKQIEEKQYKKQREKNSKTPDSVEPGLTSLNIPQTPSKLRIKREKEKQMRIKHDLEFQINQRNQMMKWEKNEKLQSERKEIEELTKKFLNEEKMKTDIRRDEFEFYAQSWKNQMQLKELNNLVVNMEIHGMIPRTKSFLHKKPQENLVIGGNVEGKVEIEDHGKSFDSGVKRMAKNVSYYDKAKKLKRQIEEKEKNSYTYKIKELIKQAKSSRPSRSSSKSPIVRGILKKQV